MKSSINEIRDKWAKEALSKGLEDKGNDTGMNEHYLGFIPTWGWTRTSAIT